MNFCPKCEFMLYTKTADGESKELINYCKNCFWSGTYITGSDKKISVYKKTYSDDYVSHSIYTNPNIIYDTTLPRINNIKCINNTCVSNIPSSNSLYIQLDNNMSKEEEIISNISTIPIKEVCKGFLQENMITKPTIIKTSKNVCVITNVPKSKYDLLLSLPKSTYNNYSITITPFTKKKNEIIFIKYNNLELKYMYICANCKSSWKN
jgi:hypothetical protein